MQKNRCSLYLRLSNADERCAGVESESIANQRKIIYNYLERFEESDIEVVDEKIDDGFTGSDFARPSFQKLVSDILDKRVDCVIVKDLSRLGREYLETGYYLRTFFPENGVRFISVTEGIDTKYETNVGDKLDIMIRTIINDGVSADISKKTRKALEVKRLNGEYTGGIPPFGYVRMPDNKNKLMIDQTAAEQVKKIFKMKIEGMSAVHIAKELNDKKIPSPMDYRRINGSPDANNLYTSKNNNADKLMTCSWTPKGILRILSNEVYVGTLIQGTQSTINYKVKEVRTKPRSEWIITYNAHEPIITQSEFDLVKKLLNLSTRAGTNKRKVYPLSGILICGCCGNRMTRKSVPDRTGNKTFDYFYCPTGKKKGCQAKMLREDLVLDTVTKVTKDHLYTMGKCKDVLAQLPKGRLEAERNQQIVVIENEIDAVNERLKENLEFQSKLYMNLVNGRITKKTYGSLHEMYESEITKIKTQLEELRGEEKSKKLKFDDAFDSIDPLETLLDFEVITRKIAVQLINSVTINPDKSIDIYFRFHDDMEEIMSFVETDSKGEVL